MDENFFRKRITLVAQMLFLLFILLLYSEASSSTEGTPIYSIVNYPLDQFEKILDPVFTSTKQPSNTETPFCFFFDWRFFPNESASSNFTSEVTEKIYALCDTVVFKQSTNPILKVLCIGKQAATSSITFMEGEPPLSTPSIYSVNPSSKNSKNNFIKALQRLKGATPNLQFAFITSDKTQTLFWTKVLTKMKRKKDPIALHYIILTPRTEEENAEN